MMGQVSNNAPAPQTRRDRLWAAARARGIPLPAILTTVLVVVVVYLLGKVVYRLKDVILLIIVAAFVALILNPAVVALQRWKIKRRGWAVAVVTLWGLLVFVGLAIAFGYPLANGISHLAQKLPTYVTDAEHGRGWLGHLVLRYHVQTWVQQERAQAGQLRRGPGQARADPGQGRALAAAGAVHHLHPGAAPAAGGAEDAERPAGRHGPGRGPRGTPGSRTRSTGRSPATCSATSSPRSSPGLVVFVTLLVIGVPFPFLWALWVALVDFLPMIGGALAGIPTVLFAAAHSLSAGIVTLVVFLIYTQIENHVLNPVVMSRTVRVNPLLVLLSILFGGEIGSWIGGIFGAFVGALLAIPAAGAIQVVVREIWQDTDPMAAAAGVAGEAVNAAAGAADGPPTDGPARPGRTGRPETEQPPGHRLLASGRPASGGRPGQPGPTDSARSRPRSTAARGRAGRRRPGSGSG